MPAPVFRVAEWNIERGIEFESIEQALTSSDVFEANAQQAGKLSPAASMTKLREQVATSAGRRCFHVKRGRHRSEAQQLPQRGP